MFFKAIFKKKYKKANIDFFIVIYGLSENVSTIFMSIFYIVRYFFNDIILSHFSSGYMKWFITKIQISFFNINLQCMLHCGQSVTS